MGASPAVFRRLGFSSLRGACAIYVLAFFAAVAFSTHRHTNDIEDLLTDGPSNSGVFFASNSPIDPGAEEWASATLVGDEPCLACFHNDFATEGISFLDFSPIFQPNLIGSPGQALGLLSAPSRSASSRGPPSLL